MKIIDISRDMLNTQVYPGDPEPRLHKIEQMPNGDHCNVTALYACLHTGTHADAPLHFIDGGEDISVQPPEAFIGECLVLAAPEGAINGDFVDENIPEGCERLLIKGDGKAWFSSSGAFAAANTGLKLVGTDALSIGIHGSQVEPHRAFLGNGIPIVEGLDLSEVEPGRYFLIALPLKMGGVEASPVRAVLIADYLFWSR